MTKRWHRSDLGPYTLAGADGNEIAKIYYMDGWWNVQVRNRSGGWLYAYAASLPAAKRKAAKMIKEEQK